MFEEMDFDKELGAMIKMMDKMIKKMDPTYFTLEEMDSLYQK